MCVRCGTGERTSERLKKIFDSIDKIKKNPPLATDKRVIEIKRQLKYKEDNKEYHRELYLMQRTDKKTLDQFRHKEELLRQYLRHVGSTGSKITPKIENDKDRERLRAESLLWEQTLNEEMKNCEIDQKELLNKLNNMTSIQEKLAQREIDEETLAHVTLEKREEYYMQVFDMTNEKLQEMLHHIENCALQDVDEQKSSNESQSKKQNSGKNSKSIHRSKKGRRHDETKDAIQKLKDERDADMQTLREDLECSGSTDPDKIKEEIDRIDELFDEQQNRLIQKQKLKTVYLKPVSYGNNSNTTQNKIILIENMKQQAVHDIFEQQKKLHNNNSIMQTTLNKMQETAVNCLEIDNFLQHLHGTGTNDEHDQVSNKLRMEWHDKQKQFENLQEKNRQLHILRTEIKNRKDYMQTQFIHDLRVADSNTVAESAQKVRALGTLTRAMKDIRDFVENAKQRYVVLRENEEARIQLEHNDDLDVCNQKMQEIKDKYEQISNDMEKTATDADSALPVLTSIQLAHEKLRHVITHLKTQYIFLIPF